MANKAKSPPDSRPLFAKLPVSLHIALQELTMRRWRKAGVKPSQRELSVEAIRRFVQAEGIEISQIEADVANWNETEKKSVKPESGVKEHGIRL
jgi:hypothetical protein